MKREDVKCEEELPTPAIVIDVERVRRNVRRLAEYAKAHGHPDLVVNPQLVFNVVLGLSVEDCSEIGGPFLGVYDLVYDRPVYPGTTITARSRTTETRISGTNPKNGVVTWTTEGFDAIGERVVGFRRSNLVRRRHPEGQA